ncbi:MAG TPA: alpha/beta fold hydrolase [Chloroflexota bacterium]|nr:alpha/beta fold hydrolase [Chloroflexota bacterium]
MADKWTEKLVYADTADGFQHAGIMFRPVEPTSARPIGVVWNHGLGGTFYATHVVRIGRALAEQGYTFIAGHNRGHDVGAMVRRPKEATAVLAGGVWELFGESPHDVAAWLDVAEQQPVERIILIGHSLGALKVVYYQANRQDPRVSGLVAASPPVRAFQRARELRPTAEAMVSAGRGQDLLPWGSSPVGSGTSSAQTVMDRNRIGLDLFGVENESPLVGQIRCPMLAFFGTNEEWVGTAADLEMIRRNAKSAARIDTRMIDGADHTFTGRESDVATTIATWVESL